ncbi:MAG: AAA family ATPase [Thaumarchaeota archaeon]|nr:AAA family ATPase [Candidatus Geocrenenecus arthurdayi]
MKIHNTYPPMPVKEDYVAVSLRLVNVGPFEEVEVEVSPLTIFIGKNSVGKSFLAQIIWALATTMPEFALLVSEAYGDMVREFGSEDPILLIYEKIRKGEDVSEDVRKLTKILIQSIPIGLSEGFKKRIEEIFGSVKAIIKRGSREAKIRIQGRSRIEFVIRSEDKNSLIDYVDYKPDLEFINMLEIKTPFPSYLKIILPDKKETIYDDTVDSEVDISRTLTTNLIYYYVKENFNPFFYIWNTAMLPDSRAGASRILLRPYPHPMLMKGVMKIDEEFSDLFFELSRAFYEQKIKADLKETLYNLLRELYCEVGVSRETGRPIIYVKMWDGAIIPYSEAPSGIREVVIPAIALASSEYGVVVIEEPEAHLHPRAQRLMARLMVRSVNTNERFVVVTTHSDYLISTLNNHIMLSGKERDKLEKLGYDMLDVLSPRKISTYLLKLEGEKSIVERLVIDESGIPDEEFAKVVEELIEERARIEVE